MDQRTLRQHLGAREMPVTRQHLAGKCRPDEHARAQTGRDQHQPGQEQGRNRQADQQVAGRFVLLAQAVEIALKQIGQGEWPAKKTRPENLAR